MFSIRSWRYSGKGYALGQEQNPNTSQISIIIPALNAATTLPCTLSALDSAGEVIVVDGGSRDGTAAVAEAHDARVVTSRRGRGSQIAAGIAAARNPWLLLLHADTRLAPGWHRAAARHMHLHPEKAGYFHLAFDSDSPKARRLERAVAWRCRILALPYGDQGLLIHRDLLTQAGGIRPLLLMEDVDLVRRLGRARLTPLDATATTSAARYDRDGWTRRSMRNLFCLTLWFIGVPPRLIALIYA